MNYPNKQSRKRIYILLYDLAEKLQKLRSGISMHGKKLEELKSLGTLGLGSSGQFGLPTPTVLCDTWSLSSHLNMNIWKFENPFQKCWRSDSVFWYQKTGPPVAEMLKSLTKTGATNYVDWNKLLSSEPWTLVFPPQIRSDQSLSHVWLFATPWIAARQSSLSITNSHHTFCQISASLVPRMCGE